MVEIDRSRMSWILYQDQEQYFISVVCGSVGIFEVSIKLLPEEVESYLKEGKEFIERFAKDVRFSTKSFSHRAIQDFRADL